MTKIRIPRPLSTRSDARSRFFERAGIWPRTKVQPAKWLDNFNAENLVHASVIVDSLCYFNLALCEAMFEAALHSLSSNFIKTANAAQAWNEFLQNVAITNVEGDSPNPSDSGNVFARMARQRLGLNERQIVPCDGGLLMWMAGKTIVFVDDFLGSGDQFIKTLTAPRETGAGQMSFVDAKDHASPQIYLVTMVATSAGVARLKANFPWVTPVYSNVLYPQDGLMAADSAWWPKQMSAAGRNLIEQLSAKLGVSSAGGYTKDGFVLAFSHGTPDASLPLICFESADWSPLVRA
jgi:hypothetical protein